MKRDKEILFSQKADGYLCCFNDQCAQRNHCLRWQVGQYVDRQQRVVTCVNPLYQLAANGHCDEYRDDQQVTMPVGMKKGFYRDMPSHVERSIKNALIAHTCRSTYYQYHNGKRPITPDMLAVIRSVCKQAGWTQPLQFDGEVTDYAW